MKIPVFMPFSKKSGIPSVSGDTPNLLCDAVRKTESLMRHSNTTYLEVLTAKQSLLEAEVQQLQTRFERIQSIIKLYHALGGGM